MLQHLHHSIHKDPFHFPSSSPERLGSRSYVATRPNPYTIKSQKTQHYISLRTTAQSTLLDPRLTTAVSSTRSFSTSQQAIDSLYRSLEPAATSPRCTSKPPPLSSRANSTLTMVKPKPRPVKALASNTDMDTPKRMTGANLASTTVDKRRRSVAEAAKQHGKTISSTHKIFSPSRARVCTRSRSPAPLASPESPSPLQSTLPRASKLVIPKITVRAPTPEPISALDPAVQKEEGCHNVLMHTSTPLYMDTLFMHLAADISKAEDGIDSILSKYFDVRKPAPSICTELLRYLATSLCRLYCCVEEPDSDLGQLKLRAISSHLFQHTVTGFVHLLDDPLAPYATANHLALVCMGVLQDFDKATNWCCRVLDGPSSAQQHLKHGELFLNVLNAELDKILQRGLAMSNKHNRLNLPGQSSSFPQWFSNEEQNDRDASIQSGGSTWQSRNELRKQWAREGDKRDQFVGIDVVRFIGQLALYQVVSVHVLAKWLDRFLLHTVHLGIPSVWEIECACALLLSVGAMLDQRTALNTLHTSRLANSDFNEAKKEAKNVQAASSNEQGGAKTQYASTTSSDDGLDVLNRAMEKIDRLILHKEISRSACDWLIQLRQLRERGWRSREDEATSLLDGFSSD